MIINFSSRAKRAAFTSFGFLAIGAITLSVSASSARASISSTFLAGLGGHFDQHNDSSVEYLSVDGGTANRVDVGDVLRGVFLIESIGNFGGTVGVDRLSTGGSLGFELTGIFETRVKTKTGSAATGWNFSFEPNPTFEAQYGTGAMAALYEESGFTAATQYNTIVSGTNTRATAVSRATNGTLQAVLGFAGLPGEGWDAFTTTDMVSALPAGLSVRNGYFASLNYIGTSGDYAALNIPFAQQSQFTLTDFTQFSIGGQIFGTGKSASTDFPVGDSTDIFFNVSGAVPEATSIICWGLLGASVLSYRTVRSRRA